MTVVKCQFVAPTIVISPLVLPALYCIDKLMSAMQWSHQGGLELRTMSAVMSAGMLAGMSTEMSTSVVSSIISALISAVMSIIMSADMLAVMSAGI